MFYACAIKFDVTENLENFFSFQAELNKAVLWSCGPS